MSDDIVTRLRGHADCYLCRDAEHDMKDAADEIERLRADIERLQNSLNELTKYTTHYSYIALEALRDLQNQEALWKMDNIVNPRIRWVFLNDLFELEHFIDRGKV